MTKEAKENKAAKSKGDCPTCVYWKNATLCRVKAKEIVPASADGRIKSKKEAIPAYIPQSPNDCNRYEKKEA